MKTQPVFHGTSFTERLTFTTKPDRATRKALVAAGFHWNGVSWWRHQGQTEVIKPKALGYLLVPIAANDNEPVLQTA